MSKKQASRLGELLIGPRNLGPADAAAFQQLIDHYDMRTTEARNRIEAAVLSSEFAARADLTVTGRTKTTLTLRQKLARSPDIRLPYVRDISGVRIVGDMLLDDQDALGHLICAEFDCLKTAKWVDRRATPVSGYRAVHVVVTCEDVRVEVQIRTELQALWADLYERQADLWGRGIRYGEPPEPDHDGNTQHRVDFLSAIIDLSLNTIDVFERRRNDSAAAWARRNEATDGLEKRAAQLLATHTRRALRKATRIKAALATVRRADEEIEAVLNEWSGHVKHRLSELASRADLIK